MKTTGRSKKKDYEVKARGPGKPIKKMAIPAEEFFLVALASYGLPSREPFLYTTSRHANFLLVGVGPWCHYHPDGQRWTALVMLHGEAKSRAHRWYSKYWQWCKDTQQQLSHTV